jgi:hypothetical protein
MKGLIYRILMLRDKEAGWAVPARQWHQGIVLLHHGIVYRGAVTQFAGTLSLSHNLYLMGTRKNCAIGNRALPSSSLLSFCD